MKVYKILLVILILSILTVNSHAQQTTASVSSQPIPVTYNNEVLFYVYSNIGPYSAKERAKIIEGRINQIIDEQYNFDPDKIRIEENETASEIFYGDRIIISITESEAALQKKSRDEIAKAYAQTLNTRLKMIKESRNLFNLLVPALIISLYLLFLFLIFNILNHIFKGIYTRIKNLKGIVFKSIKIQQYELLGQAQQVAIILNLARALKIIFFLTIAYLSLLVVFSFLPWTKGLTKQLIGYIIDPIIKIATGIINYIPNLFTIAIIVIAIHYLVKFIHMIFRGIENEQIKIEGFYAEWARPTFNIISAFLYVFMLISIFPYLPGANSPIFQGVSILLGILVSFASSSSISNLIAGIIITYMRPFKIGDRVKIGDAIGDVTEKSLLLTRLRTIKNEDITIPNSTVLSSHIINYSSSSHENIGLILNTTITIGYDTPWKTVHQLLIEAANNTEDILKTPQPFVLQTSLDDYYISYQLNAYTDKPNSMADIYSKLHQNIQDSFAKGDVEIMSPHYFALRDGNQIAIPPNK